MGTHIYCFWYFSRKHKANKAYTNLLPSLIYIIQMKGRHSPEATGLLAILGGLPSTGAKSLNFAKRYINKEDGWKELPENPEDIPFGFWH